MQNNELAHLTEAQNLTSGGGYYPAPATPPEMSVLSEFEQYDIKPQVLPGLVTNPLKYSLVIRKKKSLTCLAGGQVK